MGYVVSTSAPAAEPLSLAQVKNYLRVDGGFADDDGHIAGLISAAREHCERVTGKCLAQRTLRQVMDSFPYYTDTIQSQLAYPPSYYSLPLYSSTLWNYSQMIKLFYPPVIGVQGMRYVDADGNAQTLMQDVDFTLDRIAMPARIFPAVGTYWPPSLYVANSLEIDYTAGYLPNPDAAPDQHVVASGLVVTVTGSTGGSWTALPVIVGGAVVALVPQPGGTTLSGVISTAFAGGGGAGASATAVVAAGALSGFTDLVGGAGYTANPPNQQPDSILMPGIPHTFVRIMLMLIDRWYDNRSAEAPPEIDAMLAAEACIDFSPSRG